MEESRRKVGIGLLSKTHGIILLGANGSGKSTVGRKLARLLGYAHFDTEDYYYHKTNIPYTVQRSKEERQNMLLSDIEKHRFFVLTGDIHDWGDNFKALIDFAVYLEAPKEIRMRRIEKRHEERFGDRVKKGGDMYENQRNFLDFAANRSIIKIKERALKYPCPVLWIDGTKTVKEITDEILSNIETRKHYDLLIDENVDPTRDPEILFNYMKKWDGDEFIKALELSKDKTVLEVGVGTGRIAIQVCDKCRFFIGIDFSERTIERAEDNLREFSNKELIFGDFLSYQFAGKFDVIYSSLTFMHIKEKRTAIQKVADLLEPDGRFVLSIDKNQQTELDYGTRKIKVYPDNPEEIATYIIDAGLEIVRQFETEFAVVFIAVKKGD